jgi:hypothetical protein
MTSGSLSRKTNNWALCACRLTVQRAMKDIRNKPVDCNGVQRASAQILAPITGSLISLMKELIWGQNLMPQHFLSSFILFLAQPQYTKELRLSFKKKIKKKERIFEPQLSIQCCARSKIHACGSKYLLVDHYTENEKGNA